MTHFAEMVAGCCCSVVGNMHTRCLPAALDLGHCDDGEEHHCPCRGRVNDAPHDLTMEVQDEPRMFRAVCSCGFTGPWKTTNAAMGSGHRHRAQVRRRTRVTPPGLTKEKS